MTLFGGRKRNLIPAYSLLKMHQNHLLVDQTAQPQKKTLPKKKEIIEKYVGYTMRDIGISTVYNSE